MKLYKTTAVVVLLHSTEAWKGTTQTKDAEMQFLRVVKECTTMDKIQNEEIRKEVEQISMEQERNTNSYGQNIFREQALEEHRNRHMTQADTEWGGGATAYATGTKNIRNPA